MKKTIREIMMESIDEWEMEQKRKLDQLNKLREDKAYRVMSTTMSLRGQESDPEKVITYCMEDWQAQSGWGICYSKLDIDGYTYRMHHNNPLWLEDAHRDAMKMWKKLQNFERVPKAWNPEESIK